MQTVTSMSYEELFTKKGGVFDMIEKKCPWLLQKVLEITKKRLVRLLPTGYWYLVSGITGTGIGIYVYLLSIAPLSAFSFQLSVGTQLQLSRLIIIIIINNNNNNNNNN